LSKKIQGYDHSKHNHLIMPNVLNREFSVTEPSKVWVSDITYIRVKEGFLYLTTVLDPMIEKS
jgi:transposase InsO family protein